MTVGQCESCDAPAVVAGRWCLGHAREAANRWKRRKPRTGACHVEGCRNRVKARGMCRLHYVRWHRTGSTEPEFVPEVAPEKDRCRRDGCRRRERAVGLCSHHYRKDLAHRRGEPCAVDGCDRYREAREWCGMHYQRVMDDGNPGPANPLPTGRDRLHDGCRVEECDRPHRARGLCSTHVKRLYRGDPDPELVAVAAPSSHSETADA